MKERESEQHLSSLHLSQRCTAVLQPSTGGIHGSLCFLAVFLSRAQCEAALVRGQRSNSTFLRELSSHWSILAPSLLRLVARGLWSNNKSAGSHMLLKPKELGTFDRS